MAEKKIDIARSFEAGEDLSGKQYTAVYLSAKNTVKLATSTNSSLVTGILDNKPKSSEPATVVKQGLMPWYAGAAVSVGAIVTSNGSGRAIAVTSGGMAMGQATEAAGADGDLITIDLFPPVRWGAVP